MYTNIFYFGETFIQISPTRGSGIGISPPVIRRPSKWTKVKKAFLTSRRYDDSQNAMSMPSSPQAGGFKFSQHEDMKVKMSFSIEI